MPGISLAHWKKLRIQSTGGIIDIFAVKTSAWEVCPRCASLARIVYDQGMFASEIRIFGRGEFFFTFKNDDSSASSVRNPSQSPYPECSRDTARRSDSGDNIRWASDGPVSGLPSTGAFAGPTDAGLDDVSANAGSKWASTKNATAQYPRRV
jgi:hypothetical protein